MAESPSFGARIRALRRHGLDHRDVNSITREAACHDPAVATIVAGSGKHHGSIAQLLGVAARYLLGRPGARAFHQHARWNSRIDRCLIALG